MDYTTRPDGSGLGLYMSRTLIEAQGGHLYVESSHLLWGTRFVMELPSRM
jgi:signal transduction histidine kinase